MKIKSIISFIICLFVINACSNSILLEQNKETSNLVEPSLFVDNSKGLAVFVDENNVPIEIQSYDEIEERNVSCIEPYDFKIFPQVATERSAGTNKSLKAVVLGKRDDGNSGLWLVFNDNSVEGPRQGNSMKRSTHLVGGSDGKNELVGNEYDAFLGWTYLPTIISDDGNIVGGFAENKNGYTNYFINIKPGKKASIYWNLYKSHDGFYMISRAKVVGVLPETKYNESRIWRWFRRIISKLKLLFLDNLQNYLVEPASIENYDNNLYKMSGLDKNGLPGIAIFDRTRVFSIEPDSSGSPENNPPYSIIGPESPQQAFKPSSTITGFQLIVSEIDGNKDPDGDDVFFKYSIESQTSGTPEDIIAELDGETGIFSLTHTSSMAGQFVKIKFWTEDSFGLTSTAYFIDFYFESN